MKANDKGKIKIKRIEDNTAAEVEILIHLPANISPDKTIDTLPSRPWPDLNSPLGCIIRDDKPHFMGVSEMLRRSTDNTVSILKQELLVKDKLEEQWHFASLERIFIENRIYRDIEEQETWEGVIKAIRKGLVPHIGHLKRDVNDDDVVRLTEIRSSVYQNLILTKLNNELIALEADLAQVKPDLANLTDCNQLLKALKANVWEGS